jgi:putative oxidoreductase
VRDAGILALRLAIGGYLAAHGAQKLFGHFDGPGLDKAAVGFEHMGLRPGKPFAALAATSELAGGVLTATGLASPVGPVTIAGAMAVAVAVHMENGAMGQKGGYELPLTDLIASLALAATGPGRYSLDRLLPGRLPRRFVLLTVLGASALSAYSASKVLEQKRTAAPPDPASDEQAEQVPDPAAG